MEPSRVSYKGVIDAPVNATPAILSRIPLEVRRDLEDSGSAIRAYALVVDEGQAWIQLTRREPTPAPTPAPTAWAALPRADPTPRPTPRPTRVPDDSLANLLADTLGAEDEFSSTTTTVVPASDVAVDLGLNVQTRGYITQRPSIECLRLSPDQERAVRRSQVV